MSWQLGRVLAQITCQDTGCSFSFLLILRREQPPVIHIAYEPLPLGDIHHADCIASFVSMVASIDGWIDARRPERHRWEYNQHYGVTRCHKKPTHRSLLLVILHPKSIEHQPLTPCPRGALMLQEALRAYLRKLIER